MDIYSSIVHLADSMQPELTAIRRDFHKYAEGGWFEIRTSSIIARYLTNLGYEVLTGEAVCKRDSRMGVPDSDKLEQQYRRAMEQGADPEFAPATRGGMTGVIGILRCGEGPTVAMRFDIDALGVVEATDESHLPAREGFISVNPGVMHACGHDGHAAIGMGVAKVLMALKDQLHGTVKLIFQPAEEGVQGAKAIVDNGHLDHVQYFLSSHITGRKPDAQGAYFSGSHGSLATSKYDVVYTGVSCHAGGSPHLGHNALLAAATAVLNLHAIPRHASGGTRINVGVLHAGSGRNVIPDEAKMEFEVRGDTTELNDFMSHYAMDIVESAAKMHGCTCQIRLMGAANSMVSDEALMTRIRQITAEYMGIQAETTPSMKNAGSEDVSYMMQAVQAQGGLATFMRLLSNTTAPAHSRAFDFDENCLSSGVKIFCGAVADLLK